VRSIKGSALILRVVGLAAKETKCSPCKVVCLPALRIPFQCLDSLQNVEMLRARLCHDGDL